MFGLITRHFTRGEYVQDVYLKSVVWDPDLAYALIKLGATVHVVSRLTTEMVEEYEQSVLRSIEPYLRK
jgi:hypothetical protein